MTSKPQAVPLFPILLVHFIGTFGFSIVLPFLVFLTDRFGGNAVIYGIMGATYPTFQLIGAPLLGRWSDHYGRRKVLFVSHCGTLLSWAILLTAFFVPMITLLDVDSVILGEFLLTIPLLILFLARGLDGLTGGNVSVAHAYLADVSREEDRNKNFGKLAMAANVGFVMGPALAGILGGTKYEEMIPIAAALLISLAAAIIIAVYLPESKMEAKPEDAGEQTPDTAPKAKARFSVIFTLPTVPFVLGLYFLIFVGFNLFYTAFPVHALKTLMWSVPEMGFFFAFIGFSLAVVQGPLLSKLSKRYSDRVLAIIGSFLLGTNFILMASTNIIFIFCGALLFALGNGLMWPSVLSILSKVAGEEHQGLVQVVAGSAASLASIIGLILGGFLYDMVGAITFWVSSGIIYIVFLLLLRFLRMNEN